MNRLGRSREAHTSGGKVLASRGQAAMWSHLGSSVSLSALGSVPLFTLSLSISPFSVLLDLTQVTLADFPPLESPDGCRCLRESFTPRSPWVLFVPRAGMPVTLCLLPGSWRWDACPGVASDLSPALCMGPACAHASCPSRRRGCSTFHRPLLAASEGVMPTRVQDQRAAWWFCPLFPKTTSRTWGGGSHPGMQKGDGIT